MSAVRGEQHASEIAETKECATGSEESDIRFVVQRSKGIFQNLEKLIFCFFIVRFFSILGSTVSCVSTELIFFFS